MSIYKGGYILADISAEQLDSVLRDFLPKDLKDYLQKYVENDLFNNEVLSKSIILIIQDPDGNIKKVNINTISPDKKTLYTIMKNNDGNEHVITIYGEDLRINARAL